MSESKQEQPGKPETAAETISRLKAELESERAMRSAAEGALEAQMEAVTAQAMMTANIREVYAGKVERIRRNDKGEPVTKRVAMLEPDGTHRVDETGRKMWRDEPEMEEIDAWQYRINLPPSGGLHLSVNGVQLQHGEMYRFDIHGLRQVKEMVSRAWEHERSINGRDDNEYRMKRNSYVDRNLQGHL